MCLSSERFFCGRVDGWSIMNAERGRVRGKDYV